MTRTFAPNCAVCEPFTQVRSSVKFHVGLTRFCVRVLSSGEKTSRNAIETPSLSPCAESAARVNPRRALLMRLLLIVQVWPAPKPIGCTQNFGDGVPGKFDAPP